MRAQDDTPNEAFNDMERYSRLAEFFSSPNKTFSELYPFSPYTSNLPLSECKIPDDTLSLSSCDEDFSASDLSPSPVTSGNELQKGRRGSYDEPPSRLYLKRRPTRKAQQSGKDDAQKRIDGRQHVVQWSEEGASRRGRAGGSAGRTGRDEEQDGRPASRRRESGGESSRSSSPDGDSPDRSARGRSRRARDGLSRARLETSCLDHSDQERSSSESTRKRKLSSERADPTRQRHSAAQRRADASRSTAAETQHQPTDIPEPRRTTSRSPEVITEDAITRRNETSPHKMHTHQRSKGVSRGEDQFCRQTAKEVSSQNVKETVADTSRKLSHYIAEPRRRRTDGKPESNEKSYDTPLESKNDGVSPRLTSDSPRRLREETSYLCKAQPTDAHSDYKQGALIGTWNFTLPSSNTNAPSRESQESTVKNISRASNDTSSRTPQQKRHTKEVRESTPKNPLDNFFLETRSSMPMASWTSVEQARTLPPKLSTTPPSRSAAIPTLDPPREPIAVTPADSSDASTFLTCTMSPFQSQQSSAHSIQENIFSAMTPFYFNINKMSTHQESEKGSPPAQDVKSQSKTKSSLRDRSEGTRTSPTHGTEQTSTANHLNNAEKPVTERVKFSQKAEYSFDKARSIATCTTPMNSKESIKTDGAKLSDVSAKKPAHYQKTCCFAQEAVLISAAKCDRKFPKSGKNTVPPIEPINTNAPNRSLHRDLSWKSTSGSDVTEGDSLLDIEKFKQAVRSVEVPPEFLEPLEDSEDSENVLNILETISESPLEDCSDVNNSSNYGDDEHVSAQSNESVNSAGSHANRNHLGNRSGSDLSDIQLHYAYGRNKNDQLELQWIKLEKIVDTASESSQGSVIDSPFNKQGESQDLQIRSMNLPNASTAPRHGDADRGPLATYLTLPTQSPASGEDPELAIVVLHEENLSEHQKDVINRYRTGMKRRRSRSSSEMKPDVFGSSTTRENDQPLIIPISNPSTDIGTTAYAVIADSEPEVPLSVDVDVKSWFAKQRTQKVPPIVINQCPSKGLFNIVTPSYSESRLVDEYQKYETNLFGFDSKSPEHYVPKPVSENQRSDFNSSPTRQKSHSSRRSASKNRTSKDLISLDRPKTAPPSSDMNKFRGLATLSEQTAGDKNTSQAKQKARKRTSETSPSPPRDSARASPNREHSPKQTSISPHSSKSPSGKTGGNVQLKSPDRSTKGRATTNQDNTVKVLFEPKSKAARAMKGEPKTTQNTNHSRASDDKTKHTDSESASGRHKRSSSASSRRTDKSSSSLKSNTSDRPKTASTGSDRNRPLSQRGPEAPSTKAPESRVQKRCSSASEQRRAKAAEGPAKEKSTAPRSTTAPSGGGCKKPLREVCPPQTVPLPACPSSDSVASSDSASGGGVPRYRLRRNISYLSEYRKTIESLRAKCAMKDHMIDALLEELQRLAPAEEALRRLRVRLSNRNLSAPPRRDYSCCEVADLLPREQGGEPAQAEAASTAPDEQCVCPTEFRVAGKVGCDCLLLTWKSAPKNETVTGYEVEVDGQLSQRVRSPTRTSALLMDLDLSREMSFSLRTLRARGLPPCHPPLRILFAPSGDDWALDDPQPR